MKKILSLFALLFILGISTSIAQKPTLNHIAHYIYDLQKSTAFYTQVIGLDTIPEPFHDGKHTWLSIGDKTHLHLIQGAKNPENHDKNSHICFTVPSVEQFIKRLKDAEVPFEDWAGTSGAVTHRVDGVLQIYFKDPDGYWIEVNDARQ
jgi:lactoylglutathione lyase